MSQHPTHDPLALASTLEGATSSEPAAPMTTSEVLPGRLLGGRYEVIRAIGAGAMGQVFEARHVATERRVAVKLLHASVGHDPAVIQRFMTEARAAGRARHRNIVEVLDFGADGPSHWMVLEYLDGEPLEALVEREAPLAPARVAEILDPILRAVAHAHALGIIHRDLKPGNLFLAREAGTEGVVPKVLDFGIAKHTGAAAKLTGTDTVVGTPAYMAPEQVESSRDVTAAADQYAMGCVAYEMLSGRLPVEGDSLHALLIAKATREPEALAAVRPELAPALCACVMRAIARDPARRHPDLESFRAALVAACRGAVTEAPPEHPAPVPPPPEPAPAPPSTAVVATPLAPATAPVASPRRGVAVAAAALALMATGIVWSMTAGDRAPTGQPPPPPTAVAPRPRPEVAAPAAAPAALPAPPTQAPEDASGPVVAAVVADEPDGGEPTRRGGRRHHRRATQEPAAPQGHRLSVDHHNPLGP